MEEIKKIQSEIKRRIESCKEQESLAWEDNCDEDAMWWQGAWKALKRLYDYIEDNNQLNK